LAGARIEVRLRPRGRTDELLGMVLIEGVDEGEVRERLANPS
jgi:hypothetical protein